MTEHYLVAFERVGEDGLWTMGEHWYDPVDLNPDYRFALGMNADVYSTIDGAKKAIESYKQKYTSERHHHLTNYKIFRLSAITKIVGWKVEEEV